MQKLSQENIQFIDTYLKNSEVVFNDIRIEMVDHVASDIEQQIENGDTRDFYYIFKDYMVKNKAQLINENRKYSRISDKKIVKSVLKKALSFNGVLIFIGIVFSFNLVAEFTTQVQLFRVYKYAPLAVMVFTALVYFIIVKRKQERYSLLERMGLYFILIFQIIDIFIKPFVQSKIVSKDNLIWITLVNSAIIYLLILLILVTLQFKKEYQSKFKSVV